MANIEGLRASGGCEGGEGGGLTRRTFVAGAAGVAACAGVAAQLASAPEARASEGDADAAPADEDDGYSPIAPLAAPAAWDDEAEIVVIGTGGGGLAATTLAAQNGASVITIEKLSEVGGNTKEASYMYCPGGSRFQNEQGIPFDPEATLNTYWPMYRSRPTRSSCRP